jgi:hypothetical protein
MTDQTRTRTEELAESSEIYRRLRSTEPLVRPELAPDLPGKSQMIDPTRSPPSMATLDRTPSSNPTFLRRMLTRRIDAREILLLLVTAAVVIVAYR